ncbi:integrase core domain-containing protein [Clostridium sp.]|uniref:integrase core domain-containing protein n=1 Tax=Clostridium sp. TaxID=1506 RepID=UPI0039F5FB6C
MSLIEASLITTWDSLKIGSITEKMSAKKSICRRSLKATDNGPQFVSYKFSECCEEIAIEHERIPVKTPNKNAHVESFHRILEDDCLKKYEFQSYAEAYEVVNEFMEFYNKRRIHFKFIELLYTFIAIVT